MTAMLLERERELAVLRRSLDEARSGRGRIVLVEGPAGIGKTSLLRAAADLAAQAGFTELRARASELEHDFAYGCVRQLFEPIVAKATGTERQRLFGGAAGAALPLLVAGVASAQPPAADTSFAVLHGVYWLVNNLADDGPVVALVDDVQWSDAESMRFLNYLAPRLEGLAVAVIASTRGREVANPDLARLAGGPETTVVRPGSLSAGGTATMCAQRLGKHVADGFAAACREATGGNPFFLEAVLREVEELQLATDAHGADVVYHLGPAAVAEAVLLRLSTASAAAAELVRAVAVLGDGASLAEAAAMAGLAVEEAATSADVLAAMTILEPGEPLRFTHSIVREAVSADIAPLLRADAHGRAAAVLAACGASEERIAAQLAEATPSGDPARVELLRRVAAESLVRGAPGAAAKWLGRALIEPPTPELRAQVLVELGSAELRTGVPEAAADHLDAAIALAPEPGLLAMAGRLLANARTWLRESDRAVAMLESLISLVEPADRELALFLEADLAAHAQLASLAARDVARARLARCDALGGTTPGERIVLASKAFERARASDVERDAVDAIAGVLTGGRLLHEQMVDVPATIYVLLVGLLATDALDLVDDSLGRMLDDAQRRSSTPATAFVLAHQAVAAMRRGAVARAEASARTALDLLTAQDIPLGTALALAVLVDARVESGALDVAESALDDSVFRTEIPPGMPTNALLAARGMLRLAQGRPSEGFDDLLEFGRRDEAWGGTHPNALRWRSWAALAADAMGDDTEARRLAGDDLRRARRWGAASGVGIALRATALVTGGDGMIDGLADAVAVLETSPARLEHARALVDLGAALRRANRRADARRALDTAINLAARCGARALAGRARAELGAAGGRSSDPFGIPVEQLTASELRVAELAAQGHSNPAIAQALYVTRKTVETHLGRVYLKLGISGRSELAAALAGPVEPPVRPE